MAAINRVATRPAHFAKVRRHLASAIAIAVCSFRLCLVVVLIQTQSQNARWPEAMSVL